MTLSYRLRMCLDQLIGFHTDCLCNYVDYAEWEDGKITLMYADGIKFVPEKP